MHIAIIGTRGLPPRYSGIESAVHHIVQGLAARGHRITVYCRKRSSPENARGAYGPLVDLVYLPTLRTKHTDTLVHTLLSCVHAFFIRCDIVHFHALGPSLFSFLPRLCGKKVVVTVHALDWKRKKWNRCARLALRFCEGAAFVFAHELLTVSTVLKEHSERVHNRKVRYIPNGVVMPACPEAPSRSGAGEGHLLFVGRLVPEKGLHTLLRAFSQLDTDKKLVIAGSSAYSDEYVSSLRRTASGDPRIQFTGYVTGKELEELYRHAYLFILPSEVEGSPIALLEAMSHGRCVLVAALPECLEMIGEDGFSFRSGDAVDLRDKLRYCIENPGQVADTGARARRRVADRFDWGHSIDALEGVYRSLA